MKSEHKELMKQRKRNICLTVAYDGTEYHGFQRQKNCTAVQNVLEDVLPRIFNDSIELAAAGRTDAGVHAKGQVVNFFTDGIIPVDSIPRAANRLLPNDIVVTAAREVDRDFSALHSAKDKIYIYKVHNNKIPNPLLRRYSWHYEYNLQLEPMQKALEYIVGTHDFSSFKAAGGAPNMNPVRTIYEAQCEKEDDMYTFRFWGNGFLYHMVRNIVGTVATVGNNRMSLERFKQVIVSKDRTKAGKTAPPEGLFLWQVNY
ncbi:tRNA pseudouridine(38-40) synthase TruA [Pectinatus brassicae]|uniref:tRNA pseudouridine synthase A n=1 Tax=Pectinatus brassicae TaxID=862415 RepID=A0A840UQU1_9FIRM|nr:tRNA pseudouridine(38-40) synthase TruA [Pectinatus brassicae]MBB5337088.1 tRNA pseudouridine38-40 synthase [Pectinatus brassicae]